LSRHVDLGEALSATKPSSVNELGSIARLLQGGALGAYRAGVYEALDEHGIEPNWLAGISIGAFNGAIIARPAKPSAVEVLDGLEDPSQ
jgi:NTE family protein